MTAASDGSVTGSAHSGSGGETLHQSSDWRVSAVAPASGRASSCGGPGGLSLCSRSSLSEDCICASIGLGLPRDFGMIFLCLVSKSHVKALSRSQSSQRGTLGLGLEPPRKVVSADFSALIYRNCIHNENSLRH